LGISQGAELVLQDFLDSYSFLKIFSSANPRYQIPGSCSRFWIYSCGLGISQEAELV